METKKCKDELFERIIDDLKKWAEADESHRGYMLLANNGERTKTVSHCSMGDLIMMLLLSTIDISISACAIKKAADIIDRFMQSEITYQKLKDDEDLSELAKDKLFIHYFKQAIERRKVELGEAFPEGGIIDSDNEAHNDDEQS